MDRSLPASASNLQGGSSACITVGCWFLWSGGSSQLTEQLCCEVTAYWLVFERMSGAGDSPVWPNSCQRSEGSSLMTFIDGCVLLDM